MKAVLDRLPKQDRKCGYREKVWDSFVTVVSDESM